LRACSLFAAAGRADFAAMMAAMLAAMSGYMFSGLFKQSAYSNVFWVLVAMAFGCLQAARSILPADRSGSSSDGSV
jgi:hypothetical protein